MADFEAGQDLAADNPNSVSGPARAPRLWRCLNCGQMVFSGAQEAPSDICQGCKDMTTWQPLPE